MPELEAFTAMRLPKDLFEARRAAERENITLSDLMRSALARAVKEAAMRRRKPEIMEGGVGPP
jgi:hypothetical protein